MKTIVVARELAVVLKQDESFFNRGDVNVLTAASSDEALRMHRVKRAHLIITELDLPGMPAERFCSLIRDDEKLRSVSLIMVCKDEPAAIARSAQCRANAVLLRPVHPLVLVAKARQLLDISSRDTFRVLLRASIEGHAGDETFFCRSRNISATGILIETNAVLAEGARMSLSLVLPGPKQVRASCKIIRINERSGETSEHQYGLMFTDLSSEAKQALQEFSDKTPRTSRPGIA